MPRHQYIGKQSKDYEKKENYFETINTFEEIYNDKRIDLIKKPNYQGSLIEDKIDAMVEEYLKNPLLLRFKDKIIIGCLKKNWYIIDGQHRIEMSKILFDKEQINDKLTFCWYECKNEQEMKGLFISVNHDSIKNRYYISNNDIKQIIKEEFTGILKKHCIKYFSKEKKDNSRLKTIEELVKELDDVNYFHGNETSQSIYKKLQKDNETFYDIYNYEKNISENDSLFYFDEKKCLNNKITYTTKNNNFIDWIKDRKNKPYHKYKKNKSSITPYKKKKVWINHYGDVEEGKCPISFCKNILKKGVQNGYQCGHIISEKNGGETEPNNLRPICAGCNQSMTHKNWDQYDNISYLKYCC